MSTDTDLPPDPPPCLCAHPRFSHVAAVRDTSCMHRACGCSRYRPRPAVGDAVEAWLAGRTAATGESAATGEGAALCP